MKPNINFVKIRVVSGNRRNPKVIDVSCKSESYRLRKCRHGWSISFNTGAMATSIVSTFSQLSVAIKRTKKMVRQQVPLISLH